MLVLSRHRDETIMIGDEIEITVVDIRGDKVRLGIVAPSAIAVHRKEIYREITAENAQAATLNRADTLALKQPISAGPPKRPNTKPNTKPNTEPQTAPKPAPNTTPAARHQHAHIAPQHARKAG